MSSLVPCFKETGYTVLLKMGTVYRQFGGCGLNVSTFPVCLSVRLHLHQCSVDGFMGFPQVLSMIPFLQVFSVKTMLGAPLNVKTLKFDDNQYCTHGTKLLLLLHSVLPKKIIYCRMFLSHRGSFGSDPFLSLPDRLYPGSSSPLPTQPPPTALR